MPQAFEQIRKMKTTDTGFFGKSSEGEAFRIVRLHKFHHTVQTTVSDIEPLLAEYKS
jgi:hypothetical protein